MRMKKVALIILKTIFIRLRNKSSLRLRKQPWIQINPIGLITRNWYFHKSRAWSLLIYNLKTSNLKIRHFKLLSNLYSATELRVTKNLNCGIVRYSSAKSLTRLRKTYHSFHPELNLYYARPTFGSSRYTFSQKTANKNLREKQIPTRFWIYCISKIKTFLGLRNPLSRPNSKLNLKVRWLKAVNRPQHCDSSRLIMNLLKEKVNRKSLKDS